MTDKVSFHQMKDGTQADYEMLECLEKEYCAQLPARIMGRLSSLENGLSGYQVSRLEHCLQTATRAQRDGADIDWIVSALLHDIGDDLAPENHDTLSAAVLAPYVREECTWVVRHHGIFQFAYYGDKVGKDPETRQKFANLPHFEAAVVFCERWDQSSFDPNYASSSLSDFKQMIEQVFTRTAWGESVLKRGFQTKF